MAVGVLRGIMLSLQLAALHFQSGQMSSLQLSAIQAPPTCPPPSSDPNEPLVVLPNSENCSSYYMCSNGVPILRDCPPGLYFCTKEKVCTWPGSCSFGDCKMPSQLNFLKELQAAPTCPPPSSDPNEPLVVLPNSENCSSYYMCSNGEPILRDCPPGLYFCTKEKVCTWPGSCSFSDCKMPSQLNFLKELQAAPTCPPPSSDPNEPLVVLPNSENCSSYYMCSNGVPILRDCPPGLYFCTKEKVCTWPGSCSFGDCKMPSQLNFLKELQAAPTCPPPSSDPNEPLVVLPNSENCSSYYMCSNGEPILRDCPPGLYFCTKEKVCTWPGSCSFSDCKMPSQLNFLKELQAAPTCPPPSSDPNEPLVVLPNSENCSSYYMCSNGEPILRDCPPGLYFCTKEKVCTWPGSCSFSDCKMPSQLNFLKELQAAPTCPPPSSDPNEPLVVLPNSENCSSYYMCSNGEPILRDCPPGLYFCTKEKVCTWPGSCSFSDCKMPSQLNFLKELQAAPTCPPPSSDPNEPLVVLPNSENCSSYYMCSNGEPILRDCPPGLYFCTKEKVCTWPGSCSFSDCKMPSQLNFLKELQAAPTCPPPSSDPNEPLVVLPNSENCSSYYMCSNGEPILRDCPPGLYFCTKEKVCTWPGSCSFSDCKMPSQLNFLKELQAAPTCPPPSSDPNEPLVVLPNSENCSSYYMCSNGEPILRDCPPGLYFCTKEKVCTWPGSCSFSDCKMPSQLNFLKELQAAPTCPPPSSDPNEPLVVLPNSENCSSYYMCSNGEPILRDCPPGLYFCTKEKVCTWPGSCSFSDCKMPSQLKFLRELQANPTCPPPSSDPNEPLVVLPNSENCSSYYMCSNGEPILRDCPPGLYFCTKEKVCTWPGSCSFSDCKMPSQLKFLRELQANPTCPPPSSEPGEDILYPNPANCSSYYHCDNGNLVLVECPPTLYFCSSQGVCTWSWNCTFDDCQIKYARATFLEEPTCPEPGPGEDPPVTLYPNPANCSTYYMCSNGEPILKDCPEDLYYCVTSQVCTWSWDDCDFSKCKMDSEDTIQIKYSYLHNNILYYLRKFLHRVLRRQ